MLELTSQFLLAYLLGGLMGGDVMRRLVGGSDLRASGSGNVGATNALRTRGPRFALGVLAIDIGKGVVAALALPAIPWPFPGAAVDTAVPTGPLTTKPWLGARPAPTVMLLPVPVRKVPLSDIRKAVVQVEFSAPSAQELELAGEPSPTTRTEAHG